MGKAQAARSATESVPIVLGTKMDNVTKVASTVLKKLPSLLLSNKRNVVIGAGTKWRVMVLRKCAFTHCPCNMYHVQLLCAWLVMRGKAHPMAARMKNIFLMQVCHISSPSRVVAAADSMCCQAIDARIKWLLTDTFSSS